jgi:WD40 repeat protein
LTAWDTGTWKVRSSFEVPASYDSAISPDGATFTTIDESGTLTLWEVPSGGKIKTLRGSAPPSSFVPRPAAATFSPDGNWLAAWFRLYNLRTGAVREIPGCALGFTPDSRNLVVLQQLAGRPWVNYPPTWLTGTAILGKMLVHRQYSKLLIVDVATGDVLAVSRPTHMVGWAALSPDGTMIATGGHRGDIKLWDNPLSRR